MPGYGMETPTETTAITPGVTAGLFTFDSPVKLIYFRNNAGAARPCVMRFNAGSNAASPSTYDAEIEPLSELRLHAVKDLNIGTIETVSV